MRTMCSAWSGNGNATCRRAARAVRSGDSVTRRTWQKPAIASASCSASKGKIAEAIAQFERAVQLRPDLFDAQYHLGATRWYAQDFERALPALQAAVTLRPNHAEAHYYLGLTLKHRGQLGAAIDQLCEASRLNPGIAVVQMRLGAALQEAGDLDGAIAHLEAAVRIDPALTGARNSLGLAFSQKGRGDDAVAVLEAVAKDEPAFFAARLNLGAALMQQGDLDRAVSVYRALVEADPANAEAFYNLGLALKQKDDFAGAEAELRRAMRLDSKLPDAPFTLGVVLWQTGRADEAVTLFREALARKPDYAEAHYMLGVLLKQLGNMDEAIAQFRTAVKQRPEMAEAHLSLSQALQQKGDADGARAARDEADRLNRRKADAQASTFAVSVGDGEAEGGKPSRARSSSFAKPSGWRPTTRRRTINSRSRSASLRPTRRAGTSRTRAASRRTCGRPAPRPPNAPAHRAAVRGQSSMARITRRPPPLVLLAVACAGSGRTRWRRAVDPASPPRRRRADGPALGFSFAEVAEAAGLTAKTVFGGQKTNRYLLETTGSGVAVLDYDGDDWLDVFVVNGTTLEGFPKGQEPTSHLYRNRRNGSFEDVTAKAGLVHTGWGQGACAGDYDNDGDDDLFVTYWGQNRLYRNRGNGAFDEVTRAAGLAGTASRWGAGCAFLDFDRDGRLDLFAANYIDFNLADAPVPESGLCRYKGVPVACGPPGLRGGKNLLYRNTGDGTFTDVSDAAGITQGQRDVRPGRQHARFRRRRVGGCVRGERFESERALPEQPRRHVHRYRRRVGLRVQPGRQAAGGDGRGGGRLQPRRPDGHLQDQLRRRHLDALRERRRRPVRGSHVRGRDRR